ncbi:MAG: hypothetical protein CVV06_01970 [Gammaproteobacteria bacterium HGW-Gammaproteobacteria-10]|nr:MAG: hypothetical protein CVV06_01970 [Gammaproteobacteria bacterium HGW-Gammaproteobacteria-10]
METEAAALQRQQDIDSLGSKLSNEANDVSLFRVNLAQEREALEKRLAACQFILIQAKDIKEKAAAIEQATLTRKLLLKSPAAWMLFQDNLKQPGSWWRLPQRFLMTQSGLQILTGTDLIGLLCLVGLVFLAGWRFYRVWLASKKPPCVDKCSGFLLTLRSCGTRWLAPVIGATAAVGAKRRSSIIRPTHK